MKVTSEAIIEAIRAAFAAVPRGAITIHEAEVIDEYGSDDMRAEARLLDSEPSWESVPDADIEQCTTALCYLDPLGWRYYIPAYMIWSLRYFRVNTSIVSDFTIYTFDLSGTDLGIREYKLERYQLLDAAQSRAVCLYLRYMAANEEYADSESARRALKEYWGRYCAYQDAEPVTFSEHGS